jgi:hypothetical protein
MRERVATVGASSAPPSMKLGLRDRVQAAVTRRSTNPLERSTGK